MGKSSINGPCFMAVLNTQRVPTKVIVRTATNVFQPRTFPLESEQQPSQHDFPCGMAEQFF